MSHVRQQVRDAAATLLTGLTTTGANVWAARDIATNPLQTAELPGLVVEVVDERVQSTGFNGAAAPLVCEASLLVNVIAKSAADAVDTVDDACAEVQAAIGNNTRFAGATVSGYVGTSGPSVDTSMEKPVVRAVMQFSVRYVIAHNDATVAL